ncbi:jasmonic acid-amido synthetase JAR1-like isoform X8 [Sorghum bicolor]|uniref:jasmonic acid-amido synthetase JAR1-like isoform X8 n=1 Tax=Sorghum bicolor TaxID=4558 RepID=UPI000B4253BF|nr:jasmonic acid-amido synthetase JAR1-like isoform X8 [Sorghum bicolor]XP_021305341.1 jasmonic acid-amido synthetase JAR1-like isoform X8 [Sorghum bicolor]XP_021305350.1 jasmonic acid-amido synthetase JAR1-like isoform X8 [Sorghum bicolor]|eukprot:XP_021305334.1 jasmonic acid-amido synthetase JAR1-like isoform X8 [Sorghum bicolor]
MDVMYELALQSSGTTQGKPKFLPLSDELLQGCILNSFETTKCCFSVTIQQIHFFWIFPTSCAYRNRECPIGNRRSLQFVYGSRQVF